MDPITLSTTLASLVGLICNFKQEKKDQKELSSKEFVEWLEFHKHGDLKNLILHTHNLSSEIDSLLKQNHELILTKLNKIDDILASLLSHFEGLQGIVQLLKPNSQLSDQATSILRQFVNSNSDEFGIIINGREYYLMLTSGGSIDVEDQRFLKDDLNILVELGFLHPRIGSEGSQFYGITRNADRFINVIDS
jgi:ABC-type transporter Mla subunit MlaD